MMKAKKPCQSDLHNLGAMLVELMEPATSLATPGTINLKTPERWSKELKDFIQSSATANSNALAQVSNTFAIQYCTENWQHDFLKKSPGSHCLVPHIRIGIRSARKRWKLVD
jgi:hypothetical protein